MAGERKLVVEVTSARGLMPKDGEGSSNAYCVVSFVSSVFVNCFRCYSSSSSSLLFLLY
jgi:hypothetical protein